MDGRHIDNRATIRNILELCPQTIHQPRQIHADDCIPFVVIQVRHALGSVVYPDDASNVGRAIKSIELGLDAGNPVYNLLLIRNIQLSDLIWHKWCFGAEV